MKASTLNRQTRRALQWAARPSNPDRYPRAIACAAMQYPNLGAGGFYVPGPGKHDQQRIAMLEPRFISQAVDVYGLLGHERFPNQTYSEAVRSWAEVYFGHPISVGAAIMGAILYGYVPVDHQQDRPGCHLMLPIDASIFPALLTKQSFRSLPTPRTAVPQWPR